MMMIAQAAAAGIALAAQPAERSPRFEHWSQPVAEVALPPSAYAAAGAGAAIPLVYADLVPMLDSTPTASRPAPRLRYEALASPSASERRCCGEADAPDPAEAKPAM